MSKLTESATWVDSITQIETTDPVMGGPDGIDNRPHVELAKRTLFLRDLYDALSAAVAALSGDYLPKSATAVAAAKWAAARRITLKGAVSGWVALDGTADVEIPTTAAAATTDAAGVMRLATVAEARAATAKDRVVTPEALDWLGQDVRATATPSFSGLKSAGLITGGSRTVALGGASLLLSPASPTATGAGVVFAAANSGATDGSPNVVYFGVNGPALTARAFLDTGAFGVASPTPLDFKVGGVTKGTLTDSGMNFIVPLSVGTEPVLSVGAPVDLTTSRTAGVTYTNTKSRPLVVSAGLIGPGQGTAVLMVNGVACPGSSASWTGAPQSFALSIVPPGGTYRAMWSTGVTGTVATWSEI